MKVLTKHVEIEFSAGVQLSHAISKAKLYANKINIPVEFTFNDVEIYISVNSEVAVNDIVDQYSEKLYMKKRVEA
jgi:hypothetical protein